jgi:hypothetical protein
MWHHDTTGVPVGKKLLALALCFLLLFSLLAYIGWPGRNLFVAGAASDRTAILDYLTDAVGDFTVIDDLLADPDLDLLETGSGEGEFDEAMIALLLERLTGFQGSISQVLDQVDRRDVPLQADLKKFQTAERALFQLCQEILLEYEQILHYTALMMTVGKNLESLSYYDEEDLAGTYETISAALTASVDQLKNSQTPSFLASMNSSLIDALTQMDDAVHYMLYAASISDPLRLNAADYRMGILLRRFDQIVLIVEQDMTDRQGKLMEEVEQIQSLNKGLQRWLNQNISKLKE